MWTLVYNPHQLVREISTISPTYCSYVRQLSYLCGTTMDTYLVIDHNGGYKTNHNRDNHGDIIGIPAIKRCKGTWLIDWDGGCSQLETSIPRVFFPIDTFDDTPGGLTPTFTRPRSNCPSPIRVTHTKRCGETMRNRGFPGKDHLEIVVFHNWMLVSWG